MMILKLERTPRGFAYGQFIDRYETECSIQKSSLGTEDCIWLGVNNVDPKIMTPGTGWVSYPIPDEVLLHSRMHLTQEMVKKLLPLLEHFAKTGDLPEPEHYNNTETTDGSN